MSNARDFLPIHDVNRISRNKLHKYLIRDRTEEKIFNEIHNGSVCIYQQTKNGHSSLFLALAQNKENVIKKLMELYENDHKVLIENGYNKDTAVLIAFGAKDIAFAEEKLSNFSTDIADNATNKILILMKETNESTAHVKSFSPKTEEEQKLVLEIIEKLHQNGTFDINEPNINGDTLFLVAASLGSIWILEKLLELGAIPDLPNKQMSTAFEVACRCNHIETVKWYSKKFKPDLFKFLMEGKSLFVIARDGSFEAFDYIMSVIKRLESDEHIEDIFRRRTDYYECNVLMEAVCSRQPDFAFKCLKFEPDLNAVDSQGNNLLHVVLKQWPLHEEFCKTLMKKQPELLIMENASQWTPLHLLATNDLVNELKDVYEKFPSFKNVFFKHFADSPTVQKTLDQIWCPTPGHTVLNTVVSSGYFRTAEFIMQNHIEEFDSSAYISELVIQAQQSNSIAFIEKLQRLKNFDINVPDEHNNYPILVALRDQKIEIFQHLMKSCVIKDINLMVDTYSQHNLLYYAIYKKPEVFKGNCFSGGCIPPDIDSSDDDNDVKPVACFMPPPKGSQPNPAEDAKRRKLFDIFMDLLKRGVDVNHKAEHGTSLLHVAVDYDNLELVNELLKFELTTDIIDELGNSPLHHVKSAEVFKALKENPETPNLVNLKNVAGITPFMNMVSYFANDDVPTDLVEDFLKHNCDVNSVANDGSRPIHLVNTEDWMKLFIKNGADVTAVTNQGENVIHIALKNMNWALARFLLHNTDVDRFAVTNDEVSYLGYFTTKDIKVNEIFDGALKEVYNKLLDKFINGKTVFGGLIISTFIQNSDLDKIQHPKADLHQVEANGNTCLHIAVTFNSSLEVVKTLINAGLDINAVNEKGFTPLLISADSDFTDIALLLIEQENINLNLVNSYGCTALHYAACHQNTGIKVLCKLLEHGADPLIPSNDNKTFYDFLSPFDKKLFYSYSKLH